VRQGRRRSRAGQRSHAVGGPRRDDGRLACRQCGAPFSPRPAGDVSIRLEELDERARYLEATVARLIRLDRRGRSS
jgi:hypothetical protein